MDQLYDCYSFVYTSIFSTHRTTKNFVYSLNKSNTRNEKQLYDYFSCRKEHTLSCRVARKTALFSPKMSQRKSTCAKNDATFAVRFFKRHDSSRVVYLWRTILINQAKHRSFSFVGEFNPVGGKSYIYDSWIDSSVFGETIWGNKRLDEDVCRYELTQNRICSVSIVVDLKINHQISDNSLSAASIKEISLENLFLFVQRTVQDFICLNPQDKTGQNNYDRINGSLNT